MAGLKYRAQVLPARKAQVCLANAIYQMEIIEHGQEDWGSSYLDNCVVVAEQEILAAVALIKEIKQARGLTMA